MNRRFPDTPSEHPELDGLMDQTEMRISAFKEAYFEARAWNTIYDFVIRKYLTAQKDGITPLLIAQWIGVSERQVEDWLGSPKTWNMGTVGLLLRGIQQNDASPVRLEIDV